MTTRVDWLVLIDAVALTRKIEKRGWTTKHPDDPNLSDELFVLAINAMRRDFFEFIRNKS